MSPSIQIIAGDVLMTLIFRVMKEDLDELPQVAGAADGLGVRVGTDIQVDQNGNVVVGIEGMSVNPNWRDAPTFRIPRRLRKLKSGARGPNTNACFKHGSGTFTRGPVAPGLILEPDRPGHGVTAPTAAVPLATYEADIAATRPDWEKHEK